MVLPRALADRLQAYVPLPQAFALVEKTGHYHLALVEYLQGLGVSAYVMHVQRRPAGLLKSDKRDALGLANHLYNQLEKGIQVAEPLQLVRRACPPTAAAARLKGLLGHRHELVHESTRRKNQLTAIADQLFPELTQAFASPNAPTALAVRERYPTPDALAVASAADLAALAGTRPLREKLRDLQALATRSIGLADDGRRRSLVFEQAQLIAELRLIREHLDQLDAAIAQILADSREGRILLSLPAIGPTSAAAIIAAIGNIDNFPSAAALKAYFGWAPRVTQSGATTDRAALARAGERTMKEIMFMAALRGIRHDTAWRALHERLVERKCAYDERTRAYTGKKVVIGRIAGQMVAMIYAFLKADAELVANAPPGGPLPAPLLYDPAVHQAHRSGQYRAMKPPVVPGRVVELPRR